jgi:hypothetical protein
VSRVQAKRWGTCSDSTAGSRVGHIRWTFRTDIDSNPEPFVVLDGSRATVVTSDPANITYPDGFAAVDVEHNELYGWNTERQE